MSKRRRFVFVSFILSIGFVGIQFLTDQNRFWAIGLLGISTILMFYWSLHETLGKNMTLLSLVLPFIFTLGVGIFWFLLPVSIYSRIPIVIFYGIGIYILCLTVNIFTVSAVRTIALLRAARGVGFVISLVTSFLVFDAILSLKSEVYILLPLVLMVSFPLLLQGLWTVTLEKEFNKKLVRIALIGSLIMVEVSAILYFWPVTVVVGSLFLTVTFYMLLGLSQAYLEERLFPAIIREHLSVGILVFMAMLIATHWGA